MKLIKILLTAIVMLAVLSAAGEVGQLTLKGNCTVLSVGETVTLTAYDGQEEAQVIWNSQNSAIAAISESGEVTGVSKGKTVITAVDEDGRSAILTIEVKSAPTYFELKSKSLTLLTGGTAQLEVKVNSGASTGCRYESSDESIARVSADGTVTGVSKGTCVIKAGTFNGLSSQCSVTVENSALSAEFTGVKYFMGKGDWFTAGIVTEPADAKYKVKYTVSNKKVLTVKDGTKIIAAGEGTSTLTATLDNGVEISCEITVKGRPTAVSLAPARTEIGVGESIQANPVLTGGEYATLTFKSNNSQVISVDENGIISAHSAGQAVITVTTYNGISNKLTVKASNAPAELEISETELTLGKGQLYSLFARPVDGYGAITFSSSDENVAKVTEDGLVTAVDLGSCVITARSYNGVTAECALMVCAEPEGLWAWTDSSVMGVGESAAISSLVEPWTGGSFKLEYSSSNEDAVYVSEDGVITACGIGSAVVTVCTYNGIARDLKIDVMKAPKTISISMPGSMIPAGENTEWEYSFDNGAAGSVTVVSSDTDVLFAGDGVMTGLKPGKATLTVTAYNGVTQSVDIEVKQKADSVSFVTDLYTMTCGSVMRIQAVMPEDTWANLDYRLADDGVCMILGDGSILALRPGETVLTATAFNGALTARTTISVSGESTAIDLTALGIDAVNCPEVQEMNPDIEFTWYANAFGITVRNTDESLDLSNNKKIGSLDNIRKLLTAFPGISYLDLSFTGFEDEDLADLREEFRGQCKIVWTVSIYRWNIRTDQTAFSTLLDQKSVHHTSKEFEPLKYCEDMLALDLGHNNLTTLDFLLGMPHLKIIILSDDNLKDISVLGQLTELEYVEVFTNYITDISALANLENLIDLNISNNNITDLSPVLGLEKIERIWMTHTKASDAQKKAVFAAHPNAEINTTANGPDRKGWRSHHRYFVIYEIFHTNEWIPWDTEVSPAPNYQAYY